MKKHFSTPARSLIKPKFFDTLKNSTRPLKIAGSSSSFFGAMTRAMNKLTLTYSIPSPNVDF